MPTPPPQPPRKPLSRARVLLNRYWQRYFHPQPKKQRNPFAAKTFWHSVGFALAGLGYALHQERNLRIHVVLQVSYALTVLVAGTLWQLWLLTPMQAWAAVAVMAMILLCELANTITELLVDWLCHHQFDLRAKTIKDVAAGACLLSSAVGYGLLALLWVI